MTLVFQATGQEHFTEFGISYHPYAISLQDSNVLQPLVQFSKNTYESKFELRGDLQKASGLYFNLGNRIKVGKNALMVNLQGGVDIYRYGMDLQLIDTLSTEPYQGSSMSDQSSWETNYGGSNNSYEYSERIIIPSLRINIHYYRGLLYFKGLQVEAFGGISIDNRFQTFTNNKVRVFNDDQLEELRIRYAGAMNHTSLMVSGQLGASLRLNANNLRIGYDMAFGEAGNANGFASFNQRALFFGFTKTLSNTKIAREQLLISQENQADNSKYRRYKKGDKYSYVAYHEGPEQSAYFDSPVSRTDTWTGDTESLTRNTTGYTIVPLDRLSVSFNSFLSNRLMGGVGFDLYSHEIYREGNVQNSSGTFNEEFGYATREDGSIAQYGEVKLYRYFSPSVALAVYPQGTQGSIDPFIRGRAILNYPMFTITAQDNFIDRDHLDLFGSFKVGGGVDFRLRVRGSRYLVVTVGGDYVIHPIVNYSELSVSLGYYRKKKLEKQRD